MSELKPCPFCGQSVTMMFNARGDCFNVYHYGIFDPSVCAVCEPIAIIAEDRSDAIYKWNRRAE